MEAPSRRGEVWLVLAGRLLQRCRIRGRNPADPAMSDDDVDAAIFGEPKDRLVEICAVLVRLVVRQVPRFRGTCDMVGCSPLDGDDQLSAGRFTDVRDGAAVAHAHVADHEVSTDDGFLVLDDLDEVVCSCVGACHVYFSCSW